jgi:hypothetical protein
VSFAAITLYVASQQVFVIVVYFVINSIWKLLDTSLQSQIRHTFDLKFYVQLDLEIFCLLTPIKSNPYVQLF